MDLTFIECTLTLFLICFEKTCASDQHVYCSELITLQ